MGWIIKEWRLEALSGALAERAREAAEAIRHEAERDARRAQRIARREAADAAEYLDTLERLATDLHTSVRGQREATRKQALAREHRPAHLPERRRRGGRASLRTRAVAELFAPTDVPHAHG